MLYTCNQSAKVVDFSHKVVDFSHKVLFLCGLTFSAATQLEHEIMSDHGSVH